MVYQTKLTGGNQKREKTGPIHPNQATLAPSVSSG
jgi:hypothetical protein